MPPTPTPCPVCWRPAHGRGIVACQCFNVWGRRPSWGTASPLVWEVHRLLQVGVLRDPMHPTAAYPWFQPQSRGLPVTVLEHHENTHQDAPYFGCSTYAPLRIVLCTWPDQSPADRLVTLVHEVAHLLAGAVVSSTDRLDHGIPWARYYWQVVQGMWGVDLPDLTRLDQGLTGAIHRNPDIPWFAVPPTPNPLNQTT